MPLIENLADAVLEFVYRSPAAVAALETSITEGLQAGAAADEVIRRAESDDAPFAQSDELKEWVTQGLEELT